MYKSRDQAIIGLLGTVFDSMDQGVLVVLEDMSVPVLNLRAVELLDLPRSFSENAPNFHDILAYQVNTGAISEAYMVSRINDFIVRGKTIDHKQDYTRQTISKRWLDVRTTPLPHGGFVRTYTDQTERHTISEEKRRSESAYRTLFENALIGIYQTDANGRLLRANPALVAMNGYTNETDLLKSVRDISIEWYVDPERQKQFCAIVQREGRVDNFESEIYRHLTRERIWVSENAWVVRNDKAELIGYEGTVIDITSRKKLDSFVLHAAHHDPLTGLANRTSFDLVLEEALNGAETFFLAYLDLDGFKEVNDTHGHRYGDALLQTLAKRFQSSLRGDDSVFRMGGDEFAIVLKSPTVERARATLDRLVRALDDPFQLSEVSVRVWVSIGFTCANSSNRESDLLHFADIGLYRAKKIAGSAVCYEETPPYVDGD